MAQLDVPLQRLAPVLGDQLTGSAVSFQGFLGVGVLRQLGLAAHKGTVLLQILLCLESQMQCNWLSTRLTEKEAHFSVRNQRKVEGKQGPQPSHSLGWPQGKGPLLTHSPQVS